MGQNETHLPHTSLRYVLIIMILRERCCCVLVSFKYVDMSHNYR